MPSQYKPTKLEKKFINSFKNLLEHDHDLAIECLGDLFVAIVDKMRKEAIAHHQSRGGHLMIDTPEEFGALVLFDPLMTKEDVKLWLNKETDISKAIKPPH